MHKILGAALLTFSFALHAAEPKRPLPPILHGATIDPRMVCQGAAGSIPKLSIFVGTDPAEVPLAERWLGREVDSVQLHGGRANWDDWQSSLNWLAGKFHDSGRKLMWSVPLIPDGATLAAASSGAYDPKYTALAKQFVKNYPDDAEIYLRVGWEFNAKGWNPWSAVGLENDYIGAYRAFVNAFRSVSDKFVFEWTPNIGEVGTNPELAYPGDAYVDVVGMDFYYDIRWDPQDPVKAWEYFVSRKYGLQWHQDFAAAHRKRTAYAEWGVNSDAAGPFITRAAQWFADHNVVYQSYWYSNSNFAGRLSESQYPLASAAFLQSFKLQPRQLAPQATCAAP